MAGYQNGIYKSSSKISKLTNNFDGLLIKQSSAIGYIEGELAKRGMGDGTNSVLNSTVALMDTTSRHRGSALAFFQLDYVTKRDKLRDIAANSEIEFVLNNIANDAIIYDENGRFCHPADISKALSKRPGVSSMTDIVSTGDAIEKMYVESFDEIYDAWGFDNGIYAWQLMYRYLVEGYLSFEILYDNDNNPKNIIGFKELDPATLIYQAVENQDKSITAEWIQTDPTSSQKYRTLPDNKVIYIQYSGHHKSKRVSFVETMIRSFNILRQVEYSKVMWHLMYSAIRLKTEVPIGTKPLQRAQEETREYLNQYKEDIFVNTDSGEILVDGQPKLMYYKNYVIPKNKAGDAINVEPLEFKGPDLQDDTLLKYFRGNFQRDSQLPHSRWDFEKGGGNISELNITQATQEDLSYSKMISRLKTAFSELLVKPIYIQMCMKNPGLKNNVRLRNMIGVKYNQDNILERLKSAEINQKSAETITKLLEIKDGDSSKFDIDFLVKKFMGFGEDDFAENERYKERKRAQKKSGDGGKKEDGGKESDETKSQSQSQSDKSEVKLEI